MKHNILSILLIFILLFTINSVSFAILEQGKEAPGFNVTDQKGNSINLESYRDNNLLICFIKLFDEPVKKELIELNKFRNDTPQAFFNIIIFTCNQQCYDKTLSYMTEQNMDIPLILEQNKDIEEKYSIQNQFPTFYIVDGDGKILCSRVGFLEPLNKFLSRFTQALGVDINYTPTKSGKPWIGLLVIALPDHLKSLYNVKKGLHVGKVIPNSPAQKAGIKVGDVVTEVNGISVGDEGDIKDIVEAKKPGDKIETVFIRLKPEKYSVSLSLKDNIKFNSLGLSLDSIPEAFENLYGTKEGLFIEDISENSIGQKLGIKSLDLLISADGKIMDSKEELKNLIDNKSSGSKVDLSLIRLIGETGKTKITIGVK